MPVYPGAPPSRPRTYNSSVNSYLSGSKWRRRQIGEPRRSMAAISISVRTAANADAGVGALGEGELEGSSRVGFFFPQLLVVDFELVAGVRGEPDHEGLFLV